jgi:hypothetical protein
MASSWVVNMSFRNILQTVERLRDEAIRADMLRLKFIAKMRFASTLALLLFAYSFSVTIFELRLLVFLGFAIFFRVRT